MIKIQSQLIYGLKQLFTMTSISDVNPNHLVMKQRYARSVRISRHNKQLHHNKRGASEKCKGNFKNNFTSF